MMLLSISEIINNITQRECFEATCTDGSFTIKINEYVPAVATAIHNGSRLRDELLPYIFLNRQERWYEEDPRTSDFIKNQLITIIANDSRYEYDLNRPEDECIYETAWGKTVWNKAITTDMRSRSLKKYHQYYEVLKTLLAELNRIFGRSVVYDVHSYNYMRWERTVPLFNIGDILIDTEKFGEELSYMTRELQAISLQGIENKTALRDVFEGQGYHAVYIKNNFPDTLCYPIEVKKIYCHELEYEEFEHIITELSLKLNQAMDRHTVFFCRTKP